MTFRQVTLDEAMALAEAPSFSEQVAAQNEVECPREEIDTTKWGKQLRAVYDAMKHGRWMTLPEIAAAIGTPYATPGVSARIRQLKNEYGIPHEKKKAKEGSLYEYRLVSSAGK